MKRNFSVLVLACLLTAACATSESKNYVPPSEGEGFASRGDDELLKGKVKEAKRRYLLALAAFERTDDLKMEAVVYLKLSRAALLEGDAPEARKWLDNAKTIAGREGLKNLEADLAITEAAILESNGENGKGLELIRSALNKASPEETAKLDNAAGMSLISAGDPAEAKRYLIEALSKTKDPGIESAARANLAQALLMTGDPDGALANLKKALEKDKSAGATAAIGDDLHLMGTAYEAKKDNGTALYFYRRALLAHMQGGSPARETSDRDAIARLTVAGNLNDLNAPRHK